MMIKEKINKLICLMTLEEKAAMCSGLDMWHLKGVERLGIPSIMVSDGPHGLRTQKAESDHLGINESISAVCFPSACATAASFDRALLNDMGKALASECKSQGVSILLGPAMNIKRTPLCGRNFEYFTEDPYLCGELGASYVAGVQSHGVGTSVKHFACNNQETDRMVISADISERALREIYLSGFETVVKKAHPYTMMCAYNRLNGVQVSENKRLLTDILRDEWGFDGFVMSDWGAVVDRVKGLLAGLDLEMPGSGGHTDIEIVQAVKAGIVSEECLNNAVGSILDIVFKCKIEEKNCGDIDLEGDHRKAVKIAGECIVLLKNEKNILPLSKNEEVAFIGAFAKKPRYQGGGSSHINAFKVTSAYHTAKEFANVKYAEGYDIDDDSAATKYVDEAVALAKTVDKAVIFVGLPDSFESEGYDREHMKIPNSHRELIDAVAKVQKNTVVVLHNGSPIEMPWASKVSAIVEVYLGGQGVGEATADVLYGKVNPSGKLAETFPTKLSDNPSYLNFPGDNKHCSYDEGIYVGYRYYEKKQLPVLFPFGHGLSYTQFEYGSVKLSAKSISGGQQLKAQLTIKNIGNCSGREVVQLYVGQQGSRISKPIKELKGFEKIELEPKQEKVVEFVLGDRSFSHYDEMSASWQISGGEYEISVGSSSADIRQRINVIVQATEQPFVVDMDTTLGELYMHEKTKSFVQDRLDSLIKKSGGEDGNMLGISAKKDTMLKLISGVPLRGIIGIMKISNAQMAEIITKLNATINS